MQPWARNLSAPQTEQPSGANWLKWVGPSIVPPLKPSFWAVASSWIEAWPSYSWTASICLGPRNGPANTPPPSTIGVSNTFIGGPPLSQKQRPHLGVGVFHD